MTGKIHHIRGDRHLHPSQTHPSQLGLLGPQEPLTPTIPVTRVTDTQPADDTEWIGPPSPTEPSLNPGRRYYALAVLAFGSERHLRHQLTAWYALGATNDAVAASLSAITLVDWNYETTRKLACWLEIPNRPQKTAVSTTTKKAPVKRVSDRNYRRSEVKANAKTTEAYDRKPGRVPRAARAEAARKAEDTP